MIGRKHICVLFLFVATLASGQTDSLKISPDLKELPQDSLQLAQDSIQEVYDTTETGERIVGFKSDFAQGSYQLSKEAEKLLKKGDALFNMGPTKYKEALKAYLKALEQNTEHPLINFKVGYTYLHIKEEKELSIHYLEKSKLLSPRKIDRKLDYYLGYAYQINFDLEKAINYYKLYIEQIKKRHRRTPLEMVTSEDKDKVELVATYKRIAECKYSQEHVDNPQRVIIKNMGDKVNSEYPDYDPFISADESTLIFTTRRPETRGGNKAEIDDQYYEDIFMVQKENGEWGDAKPLANKLNNKTNDAIIGLSFDGSRMLIYRDLNGGDIYESKLEGKNWSVPKKMKGINSPYKESSACYSADGNTLFFVSDRSESFGGSDIYVSKRVKNNKWTKPQNLDYPVNSDYDEQRVFIHPNGETLYFSSKGHKSIGGYDIFKSTLNDDGTWSDPENLGYPINTVDDDYSFVISANSKKGYYSSVHPGSKGSMDIYEITFLGPEKEGVLNTEEQLLMDVQPIRESVIEPPVIARKNPMTILKGLVLGEGEEQLPLGAQIEIVDNENNEVVSSFESNSETGRYMITLKSGKNYGVAVKAEGYLFHSINIVIPPSADYQVVEKDFLLKKIDVGSTIVLNNIFFDFGKSTLTIESYLELDRMLSLMEKHSNIKVEISGHTDNKGSASLNKQLSNDRAKAVVDFLLAKGIEPERLTYAGYGFEQPVASNDTEEGRQLNRRTEFKITATDFVSAKKKLDINKIKGLIGGNKTKP